MIQHTALPMRTRLKVMGMAQRRRLTGMVSAAAARPVMAPYLPEAPGVTCEWDV